MMDVIIYHNPACGTSRNVLAMIRNSGVEPHIIEYLKCSPTRLLLTQLLDRAGLTVRQILRHDVLIFGARCEKLPIRSALIP
jgi:arsenate reductase (glutaredoxin)